MRQEKRRNARQEKGKFQERVTYDEETGGSPLANMPGDEGARGRVCGAAPDCFGLLSFYTAIAASLVIAVAVMLDDGRRRRLLAIPYARLLLGFLIVPFFVAAMYNNLRGDSRVLRALCHHHLRAAAAQRDDARPVRPHAGLGLLLQRGLRASGRGPEAGVLAGYAGIPACLHVHNANYYGAVVEISSCSSAFSAFRQTASRADGISLPPLRICAGFP